MVPLASSGPAIAGAVVVAAVIFLAWLLHTESGADDELETPDGDEQR